MAITEQKLRHDTDTDILRLLSCFFVVMIHIPRAYSLSGVIYNSLARFSIPVFCMISGYYMLDSGAAIPRLLKKCLRLFAAMAAWSGIYYIYGLISGGHSFSGVWSVFEYLMTKPLHLWYFYAIICLYIFTPPLAVFAENASRREYIYTLALTFLFGSVIFIALRSGRFPILAAVIEKMKVDSSLGFVFCYLFAGYFKRFGLTDRAKYALYAGGLAGFLFPVCLCCFSGDRGEEAVELVMSFFSANSLAMGMAVFVLIKELCGRFPGAVLKGRHILSYLSSCTLGICFVHLLYIQLLDNWLAGLLGASAPLLSIPLRAGCIFLVSLLTVMLIKKLPAVKRLVSP